MPQIVKAGETFYLSIGVDDLEKDTLSLTTELYDHENKVIYTHHKEKITAGVNGKYPDTVTEKISILEAGEYRAVCTVRDENGTGIRVYTFIVEHTEAVKGAVKHFPAWETARIDYNKAHPENPRSADVFWAAEAFLLTAEAVGKPSSVIAEIKEYPGKRTELFLKNGLYSGTLFDSAIAADLIQKCEASPAGIYTLNFLFTARYAGGKEAVDTVTVIVQDASGNGIQIHRVF